MEGERPIGCRASRERRGRELGSMLENLIVELAMAVIIGMKRASQIVPWILLLPQGNPI